MVKVTISGIRGVVGEDLGLREVARFCGNFARVMRGGACVLGRDTRPSGGAAAGAAARGAGRRRHGRDGHGGGPHPGGLL